MALEICVLLCLSLAASEGYKALVVYPMPAKSHSILGNGVVRHLLKDGVEVTYLTGFGYKNAPPNLRLIDISANFDAMPHDTLNLTKLVNKEINVENTGLRIAVMTNIVRATLTNPNVVKILEDPNEQFDVVIAEWMFTELLSGIAAVYNCPLIWNFPVEVNSGGIGLVDAELNPAFSGGVLTESVPPFNFIERVKELWSRIKAKYDRFLYVDDLVTNTYNELIVPFIKKRGREPPAFADVRYNASLLLGNCHVSMGIALPLPQNYKPVGGYHIEEEVKPLPQDLQKLMDDSKHGVIYFSMGSNLKSKDWPEVIKQDLLKMFGGLQQTVLWKFEEKLPNVPKNVHILNWAPQPSILSHPNTVLFISHGGLLSSTETIHYGVPIIGVPVFGDQFTNVKRATIKGFAKKVHLSYNLANDLKTTIQEMITDPKYKQRVKELSFIYHDRPIKPGAELAHWVRHVVQTRGALHLRSPSLHVPLYQRLYLDLAVVLAVILVVALVILRFIWSVICPKKKTSKQKKN